MFVRPLICTCPCGYIDFVLQSFAEICRDFVEICREAENMRVLIAEDEMDLNTILNMKLTDAGYSVDSCYDGKEAILYLKSADYDLVILDINMPGADGFAVLDSLRKAGKKTPVLSLEELMARIRVLTRTAHGSSDNVLTAADLTLDIASHQVRRAGVLIELSAKEYQLLQYLLYNKGIVLSREKIENHIWNFDYEGGTNVVDVYISYLRKKIDGNHSQKLIRTVRGVGYVLREE